MKNKKNYTLIELLITLGIVGVLASFIMGVIICFVLVFGGCKAVQKINEDGLNPTIERILEGPSDAEKASEEIE